MASSRSGKSGERERDRKRRRRRIRFADGEIRAFVVGMRRREKRRANEGCMLATAVGLADWGRKVRKLQSPPLSLPLFLQFRCQAKPSDERGGIDSTDAGGKKQNINYPEMAKKYIARRGEGESAAEQTAAV